MSTFYYFKQAYITRLIKLSKNINMKIAIRALKDTSNNIKTINIRWHIAVFFIFMVQCGKHEGGHTIPPFLSHKGRTLLNLSSHQAVLQTLYSVCPSPTASNVVTSIEPKKTTFHQRSEVCFFFVACCQEAVRENQQRRWRKWKGHMRRKRGNVSEVEVEGEFFLSTLEE